MSLPLSPTSQAEKDGIPNSLSIPPETLDRAPVDSLIQEFRTTLSKFPRVFVRNAAIPSRMEKACALREKNFEVSFDTLVYFPKGQLGKLHQCDSHALPPGVNVASQKRPTVLEDCAVLDRVANSPYPTISQRQRYRSALEGIFRQLPCTPDQFPHDDSVLRVAIQREGKVLADRLGWLQGRTLCPHAKRIAFRLGLVIGVSNLDMNDPKSPVEKCLIVDGAVASGATVMAVMNLLSPMVKTFKLFSVHATLQGLWAIYRFAQGKGLNMTMEVGHATDGVNARYNANYADEPNRVVVGDMGDVICPLEANEM